jgi:hypothetical protein
MANEQVLSDEELKALWSGDHESSAALLRAVEAAVLAKLRAGAEPVAWRLEEYSHAEEKLVWVLSEERSCLGGEPLYAAPAPVRGAVPEDWEQRIFDAMRRAFELRARGKLSADGAMCIDDTQIGVEFAIAQFKALLTQDETR